MDDLRRRFSTLDAVPTPLDWAKVERAVAARPGAATRAIVSATPVRRVPGPIGRPAATRRRSLALLAAATLLVAGLIAGALGVGGFFAPQNPIADPSARPTAETTTNPSPTNASTPTSPPSQPAAVACPGVEAPKELRFSDLGLPGKTTSPLGAPVMAGCALLVTSGENGGGIHRIDLATGAVTNSNPAEVVFDIDANGDQLWAIGAPKANNGGTVLYRLDPATGATVRELRLAVSGLPPQLRILDGRAWVTGYQTPLQVIDLATGDVVASTEVFGGLEVGAGGVWSGLSRIDPLTFEVTDLRTTFSANIVLIVADRLYGVDTEQGRIARIDPETGRILTSVQLDDWTLDGGLFAVERSSIWVLRVKEPPTLPLKPYTTELLRVDATTLQIAERIPLEVVVPISFSATEGNLWLIDQPTRLRHGFIRIELPSSQ
jgi:hypothetical protein